ncbi:peptidylprolyl isomerase [Paenibacillus dakarensis]|uniref:peptidylprolyl isomerase n=1 Tax=Paenibacillus dakarensis TaxID=1527293 RepID=UPI0006D5AAAD|nr:peptidylprolyl isomerase [Paenibacillus dakarensis]
MPSRNKKAWKTFIVSLTAVMSMSVLAACGNDSKDTAQPQDNSKVVVKYKGGEITEKEFELEQNMMRFISPESAQLLTMDPFKEYLAKQGVTYEYLYANASEDAKKAAKTQADDLVKKNKDAMGEEQFKKALEEQKLTEQDFSNYMLKILTVMEDQKNKVTEDEIKKQFESDKEGYTIISVRHVLIGFKDAEGNERKKEDALKLANEVKSKLEKGEDFAKVAKEYSEDPGSKDNGGLYENKEARTWVPQFKEKALTLPLNKISDPVETDYGYHIMKVESRKEVTFDTLSDIQKDTIHADLASAKVDNFMKNELNDLIEKMDLPKSEASGESKGSTDEGTKDSEKSEKSGK